MSHQDFKDRLLIVAGMSRAGTTFLYHNLQKHPGIFVPRRKEVCFFGHHYDKGLDWYLSHFKGLKPEQVPVDICGLYFVNPESRQRIQGFNSRARIVIGVRDPADWIFSLYHQYRTYFEVPPFEEFLKGCTIRREGVEIPLRFGPGSIKAALEAYRKTFGGSLLLYHFPLLADDALGLLRAIESFAGLPSFFRSGNFTDRKLNARGHQHSAFVYRFLLIPGMADLVSRVFPRRLLLGLRGRLEARLARRKTTGNGEPTERDLEKVRQHFAEDRRFVARLFSRSPILLDHPA